MATYGMEENTCKSYKGLIPKISKELIQFNSKKKKKKKKKKIIREAEQTFF